MIYIIYVEILYYTLITCFLFTQIFEYLYDWNELRVKFQMLNNNRKGHLLDDLNQASYLVWYKKIFVLIPIKGVKYAWKLIKKIFEITVYVYVCFGHVHVYARTMDEDDILYSMDTRVNVYTRANNVESLRYSPCIIASPISRQRHISRFVIFNTVSWARTWVDA